MLGRPCRILQVLPKLDTGGAERVVVEICAALAQAGHQPLIACANGPLSGAALRAGAEIVPLPLATKSPLALRRNAGLLARLIRDRDIDLVHAHSRAPAWSALWAVRRTGTPFVTTYHGVYNQAGPLKRRYNAVMAAGDRVIAVSQFVGELVQARHGVGADRLRVILGGVDAARFNPANITGERVARLARDWRLPAGAPAVMLPGRLTTWKGQSLMLKAMAQARHPEAVLILTGGDQGRGKYTRGLIAEAEALGIAPRLRLAGHVEDMPAALMLADIVVNASTDPEAFGRTVVEAQAMGRIVVAADHGGARETVIDGQTGFLFPPGNAAALAAMLDQVLDLAPEQRVAWGRQARAATAAAFSVAAMQAAVLAVYGELLN